MIGNEDDQKRMITRTGTLLPVVWPPVLLSSVTCNSGSVQLAGAV
jgi:hypothetical protein